MPAGESQTGRISSTILSYTFDGLARVAGAGLFRSICSNPDHVLRHYFNGKKTTCTGYSLRTRVHKFALHSKDTGNFVYWTLNGTLLKRE